MKDIAIFERGLEFRSGQDKYEFLRKYGRGGVEEDFTGPAGVLKQYGGGSTVLQSALSTIERDANLAAIVSTFGTRPFLALDLLTSALQRKYTDKVLAAGTQFTPVAGAMWNLPVMKGEARGLLGRQITSSLRASMRLGQDMLLAKLYGHPTGVG